MEIAVINSRQDPAGVNIRWHLRALMGNPEGEVVSYGGHRFHFREVAGRLIYEDRIDRDINADLILFISRHTSIKPVPTLTVHVTGNFGPAQLGGEPGALARAAPEWMHAILLNLQKNAPAGYRVSYEVTHHGPTDISTPSLFVEIGSTEAQWTDKEAGSAVAQSILDARPTGTINLIGFGGNHYAARQTGIALSSRAAWGHIAHSREVGEIDAAMVTLMMERSAAVAAYIDRKSVSTSLLRHLEGLLDELGIIRLSETELRGIGEISWDTYCAIRECAEREDPKARIHPHDMAATGTPVAFSVDGALIEEAERQDPAAFEELLYTLSIVHLTSSDGRILPIFIVYEENRSEQIHGLISLCVKILLQGGNTAIGNDRLIIRRTRFDPNSARELGVPQGPLFGRLASGNTISVDGRVITPEMVSVRSEQVILIPGVERYI
jgi:D-aminoacyl-tRNA deacylase